MSIIKKCPICGNYVEGKRKQSYVKKVTKTGVKTAVNGAASIGAAGTGAAIGSALFPGIGTIIGGAAGLIGSAMFHTGVNDAIDGVADAVTDAEYEFTCPNCGHQWSGEDDEIDSDFDYTIKISYNHPCHDGGSNQKPPPLRQGLSDCGHLHLLTSYLLLWRTEHPPQWIHPSQWEYLPCVTQLA